MLVFLVMLLFLQNFRYTLIPTIVVPVCLLGTLAVMLPLGFSVNMMTMFGMVLAIGILVDDAIVVVENVERLMAQEGLSPQEATVKAMKQISGAIVGITLVLAAVFLPLAFMSGSVGVIYRQFSVSLAISILFSGFLALTMTPALCATLLKPIPKGHHVERKGLYGWFNRHFGRLTSGYSAMNTRLIASAGRMMLAFVVIVVVLGFTYTRLPSAFLPTEDQGYVMTDIQLPPGATYQRTLATTQQMENYYLERSAVADIMSLQGFSFSGQGQNAGLAFVMFRTGASVRPTSRPWPRRSCPTARSRASRMAHCFPWCRHRLKGWVPPAASPCVYRIAVVWAARPCWPPMSNSWPKCLRTRCSLTSWSKA